ncbi:MAG: hypothetical protein O3A20_00340 [Planctomycetota bacterium]|nr:hypothetical protein [Planctomycetota bacterium]
MIETPTGFARALAADTLADAWLLLAPGRERCRRGALDCAAALLGVREARGHPDCAIFDPVELGVTGLRVEHVTRRKDEIACVEDALRYKPLAGARRAVLLFDADRMTSDAQSALLKTAEEPPTGTFLILTACDLGALLPALRSRLRALRLPPEPESSLDQRAAEAAIPDEHWSLLKNTIGAETALELLSEDRMELCARLLQLREWLHGRDPSAEWLEAPEGASNSAEARALLSRRFQAALSLLLREDADLARADRWAERLHEALADLEVNVSPGLLLSELRDAATH